MGKNSADEETEEGVSIAQKMQKLSRKIDKWLRSLDKEEDNEFELVKEGEKEEEEEEKDDGHEEIAMEHGGYPWGKNHPLGPEKG